MVLILTGLFSLLLYTLPEFPLLVLENIIFTVNENVFFPPPKVKSAVIRMTRNKNKKIDCDEKLLINVVKTAFNQRRKTMRNSLKNLITDSIKPNEIFNLRPEQLSIEQFIELTNLIAKG